MPKREILQTPLPSTTRQYLRFSLWVILESENCSKRLFPTSISIRGRGRRSQGLKKMAAKIRLGALSPPTLLETPAFQTLMKMECSTLSFRRSTRLKRLGRFRNKSYPLKLNLQRSQVDPTLKSTTSTMTMRTWARSRRSSMFWRSSRGLRSTRTEASPIPQKTWSARLKMRKLWLVKSSRVLLIFNNLTRFK